MDFRKYRDLKLPSESGYEFILELNSFLNKELFDFFLEIKSESRERISREVIKKVEQLIDQINEYGYNLYRTDYSGDVDYENSEQTFCNKSLNIHFHGFTAQISWDKW